MLHFFSFFSSNILSPGPEHVLGGRAHDKAVMGSAGYHLLLTSYRPVVSDGNSIGEGHNNERKGRSRTICRIRHRYIHKTVSFLLNDLNHQLIPVGSLMQFFSSVAPNCSWETLRCPCAVLLTLWRFLYITYTKPRRDADPSPPSSAEVKNRVELYLCSP